MCIWKFQANWKVKITLKIEHFLSEEGILCLVSCSLWLMCVYIHSHNTGFMLGKEILRNHSKLYVDLTGSSGFLFLFWILLGIIGLNLNSNCMFFGLFHISWLLILFFFHVGEEGGEKCHSVVENNKTHCLLFGLCSIASSGSRQLIFSAFTYELLGWKYSLFLSDQHMDV